MRIFGETLDNSARNILGQEISSSNGLRIYILIPVMPTLYGVTALSVVSHNQFKAKEMTIVNS